MRRLSTSGAAVWAVVSVTLAVVVSVPIAIGAGASPPPPADELRRQQALLGSQSETALLELYGLESSLASARRELAALAAEQEELRARQDATRRHVEIAARAALVSQGRLEALLRSLYQQADPDPLAVLLGAQSLDEALTGLDSLDRAAQENVRVVESARASRRKLARLRARLAEREGRLEQLAAEARARTAELETAAAEKRATIADLRRREHLTGRQLASLEARARAAQERSAALQAVPATAAPATASEPTAAPTAAPTLEVAPAPPVAAGGTMMVSSVGYSLPGRTASGLSVGHGIAAVDPSVIPLGTRLYVPGYGEAVAADTGGAVRGATIDLWFPTRGQALAWGRRTVVITFR
ncbi:MAG TPA: 3D domain-containing protein [Gaiellaceae bacterium]|nr:3D domain-containing protein [Gaiellaceae bacterium]